MPMFLADVALGQQAICVFANMVCNVIVSCHLGLDFGLSWGWSICFHELLDMISGLIYFVFFHDVLYSAFFFFFWVIKGDGRGSNC